MRDEAIDLCGQVDFTRTDAMPLLERDTQFRFACAGCGNCCRGREDIVLSGYDLWRIAARLRLPQLSCRQHAAGKDTREKREAGIRNFFSYCQYLSLIVNI